MPQRRLIVLALGAGLAPGASQARALRRSARRVNQGSKCTKPAAMPVEQPRVAELDVNMRAARALGVAVPLSLSLLLLRADRGTE